MKLVLRREKSGILSSKRLGTSNHAIKLGSHLHVWSHVLGGFSGNDDNLIVFPPKADDNSCVYNFSISEHEG